MSVEYGALIDAERMFITLLAQDMAALEPDVAPVVTVAAEMDISSSSDTPFVLLEHTSGDQERNGPGLWSASITVNVFALNGADGWTTCALVYDAIHNWAMPGEGVTPEGHVVGVIDTSTFSRVSFSSMQGKNITQWVANFELTLRTPA